MMKSPLVATSQNTGRFSRRGEIGWQKHIRGGRTRTQWSGLLEQHIRPMVNLPHTFISRLKRPARNSKHKLENGLGSRLDILIRGRVQIGEYFRDVGPRPLVSISAAMGIPGHFHHVWSDPQVIPAQSFAILSELADLRSSFDVACYPLW